MQFAGALKVYEEIAISTNGDVVPSALDFGFRLHVMSLAPLPS